MDELRDLTNEQFANLVNVVFDCSTPEFKAELLRRLDAPWLPIETAPKDGTNPARPASEEKPE